MRKTTLVLVGILFMLLANGQSQVLHSKHKAQKGFKSKNPSVEVVKGQIDKCLRNQQAQANRKSEDAELPTLDSILIENNQFYETEYGVNRFKYDENELNTYYMDEWYAPAFEDIHHYNIENYFYNENGLEDKRTYQFGNSETAPEDYAETIYKYNDKQLVDTIFSKDWGSNITMEYYAVIEYNEFDQVSSTVYWGEYEGEMVNSKVDYYYNSSNSKIETIKEYYALDGEIAILTSFSYNGELLSQVSQTTYDENGDASELYVESFTYNENGLPTEWYQTISFDSEVVQEFKDVLTYENEDDVISPIMFDEQLDLNFLNFGRLSKMNMFEKRDGEWQDVGFLDFYYSDSIYYVTSIPTTPKISSLNVYPNPANYMISVDVQSDEPCDVKFYDVSGKLVMQSIQRTHNIDITALKNGYYLVQVQSNGKVLGSSKLLKN